ncbi:Hydroxymethylglutaryl-CoA reductase, class I/II like protein [Aduncisulcus paluster]|uniref:Hydroxymethylglutaryl-CoA reductase, class I/II like protein n=1 Tax=Aduncisulcus paluster TaxID=2918883 RepID=A0ABQ5JZI2_9EUKA|nr:Hydroxymethylglutaryl-CoA reductase, class I/II like protein [Aduncisulcus paluster]
MSSRIPRFFSLSVDEKLEHVLKTGELTKEESDVIKSALPLSIAEQLTENVISTLDIPLSVCANLVINGKDMFIPMANEESSVVSAASNGAKLLRESGGVEAISCTPTIFSQIIFEIPSRIDDESLLTTIRVSRHKKQSFFQKNIWDKLLTPISEYSSLKTIIPSSFLASRDFSLPADNVCPKLTEYLKSQLPKLRFIAKDLLERIEKRGGGLWSIRARVITDHIEEIEEEGGEKEGEERTSMISFSRFVSVDLIFGVCEAMGANLSSSVSERIMPELKQYIQNYLQKYHDPLPSSPSLLNPHDHTADQITGSADQTTGSADHTDDSVTPCDDEKDGGESFVFHVTSIVSNTSQRLSFARSTISALDLHKQRSKQFPNVEVAAECLRNISTLAKYARLDPYRQTTHNKGIMNGSLSVVLATGNDTRAFACSNSSLTREFTPTLTQYRYDSISSTLICACVQCTPVGTIGGMTSIHDKCKVCIKLSTSQTKPPMLTDHSIEHSSSYSKMQPEYDIFAAQRLGNAITCIGLCQNVSALLALTTKGICAGHMRLHLSNIMLRMGISRTSKEWETVMKYWKTPGVKQIVTEQNIRKVIGGSS